jgi:hypothetical protein
MALSCNLGTLTSWNPLGHSRPVTGLFYVYLYLYYNKQSNVTIYEGNVQKNPENMHAENINFTCIKLTKENVITKVISKTKF